MCNDNLIKDETFIFGFVLFVFLIDIEEQNNLDNFRFSCFASSNQSIQANINWKDFSSI
jgi:hypothetical protein